MRVWGLGFGVSDAQSGGERERERERERDRERDRESESERERRLQHKQWLQERGDTSFYPRNPKPKTRNSNPETLEPKP